MDHDGLDQDAFIAAIDLIGRTGALETEIGYTRPLSWYAQAYYRGARVVADDYPGPVEAAEALVRRLLEGGRCTSCNRKITLSGGKSEKKCRWKRNGPKWEKGCQ